MFHPTSVKIRATINSASTAQWTATVNCDFDDWQIQQMKDALGGETDYVYDTRGLLVKTTQIVTTTEFMSTNRTFVTNTT